jgi:hypothetical protein
MKRHFYLLQIALLIGVICNAQNVINTDRPDQSDGTHIVEKNHIQVETGVQFSSDEGVNSFDNVTLIRYGVTRRFEVRILNQYSVVHDDGVTSGLQPLTISFKNQLCKQKGLRPKLTLVSYFQLPATISPAFRGDHWGYTFTLAGRHDLTSSIKIYSNLGLTEDQQTTDISYHSTLELNDNFTEKFSGFIEYFGNYAANTKASNGLDVGFIYALRKNLAVDVAFGSPMLNPSLSRFITCGISARLPN